MEPNALPPQLDLLPARHRHGGGVAGSPRRHTATGNFSGAGGRHGKGFVTGSGRRVFSELGGRQQALRHDLGDLPGSGPESVLRLSLDAPTLTRDGPDERAPHPRAPVTRVRSGNAKRDAGWGQAGTMMMKEHELMQVKDRRPSEASTLDEAWQAHELVSTGLPEVQGLGLHLHGSQ